MKKLLFIILSLSLFAYEKSFNFNLDNDAPFTDKYYSNGIEFELEVRDPKIYDKDKIETDLWQEGSYKRVKKFIFGQKIYTPSDIRLGIDKVEEYERPYAGWLYFGYANEKYFEVGSLIKHNFYVGITGNDSFSEMYQREYHDLIGSPNPQGWNLQIDEGLGFQYTFEYSPKNIILYEDKENKSDFRYGTKINIGTMFINGDINLLLRYGRIASDFESKKIDTLLEKEKGFLNMKEYYLYLMSKGKIIVHDTTFEGGIDKNRSPHVVEVNPFVLEQNTGFVMSWDKFSLEYKLSILSSEIKDEKWSLASHLYNSLNFKYFY